MILAKAASHALMLGGGADENKQAVHKSSSSY
jgi:hypothetical protein